MCIRDSSCCVHFGHGEEVWLGIFEGRLDGEVPIWFIDYARYFDHPGIYDGDEDGYRFGVLSKAALQICKDTGWIPHVAHVHDWMTAVAAVFLKTWAVSYTHLIPDHPARAKAALDLRIRHGRSSGDGEGAGLSDGVPDAGALGGGAASEVC